MHNILPVILSGGSGTRLWPLSRRALPKQFVPLLDERPLFQSSVLRVSGTFADLAFAPPMVLTNSDFRFVVTDQLAEAGVTPGPILIEPEGRNTGPAVLAAALKAYETDPDAILLVLPSDHVIPDDAGFRAAVACGMTSVAQGRLVTFGIAPTRAETGYGYLELASRPDGSGQPVPLKRFVEKPALDHAKAMLDDDGYLWNSGIFLFAARDIIAAFETHAPALMAPVTAALRDAQSDLGFFRLAPGPWSEAEDISIDYAVMEKAETLSVVPYHGEWSDLGSWEAVWRDSPRDDRGVATSGPVSAIDCDNSLLRSEDPGIELVGLGLRDIVVIATGDAVLVADAARTQDVKLVVDRLKEKNASQATTFPRDHRPWGHFETLVLSSRFQVKRIVVKPGASLSLQSHVHRSEHWIVVSGTAKVTVGDDVRLVTENESVYVPLGAVHRMENPGRLPMVLIEVQTGAYLGEDDIIRYEDIYARGQGAKG